MKWNRSLVGSMFTICAWSVLLTPALPVVGHALETEWQFLRPSNTGIPGEEVRFARFDPAGRLWVSARYPFYAEGGVACTSDLVHWTTYANWETPLPSDIVQSIHFDPDGSVWFGTPSGLCHLDHGIWTNYNALNSPLPGSAIGTITRDAQGRIWLLCSGGALQESVAAFDGVNWEIHSKASMGFAPTISLSSLAVDADGIVWVGTEYAGGIARFDGDSWSILDASTGYHDGPARLLTLDQEGDLWLDWYAGTMEFDGLNWIDHPDPPATGQRSALTVYNASSYYLGTFSGVVKKYNGSGWQSWVYGAPGQYVLSIETNELGTWVGGFNRVRRLNEPTGAWTTYNEFNTGLPSYAISSFAGHPDGSMYIGTTQGGMAKFVGDPSDRPNATWRCFNAYNAGSEPWPFGYDTPYGSDSAEDVITGPDGAVWVASNGLARWDGANFERWTTDDSNLFSNSLETLTHDGDHTLWIGFSYGGGADAFDGIDFENYNAFEDGLPGDIVYDFAADPEHNIWVASNGGLGFFDGTSWSSRSIPGLAGRLATQVEVAPNGDLWLGTDTGCIRWDGAHSTVFTTANSGLPANPVNTILITPEGIVWIAAFQGLDWPYYGGLARFDGTTWTTFTRENSPLPHEQISALGLDASDRLWIGTGGEGVAVLTVTAPASASDAEPLSLPIRVHPNPASRRGSVAFTLTRPGIVSGGLYDSGGRRVLEVAPEFRSPGYNLIALDSGRLASGTYMLRLRTPDGAGYSRMVVVR